MSNIENTISYEKTFEEEIYDIMEKFLSNNKLSMSDIKACREICTQYENKLLAIDLTEKIKFFCQYDNYNINFDDDKEKITVLSVESNSVFCANKDDKNSAKKDNFVAMIIDFYNSSSKLIYEILDEYSDNGKQKFVFHKFTIDGHVIFKKENQSLKSSFINLSYVKELIKNNEIKLNDAQFLRLFTKLFNISNIFDDELCEIENKNEKFYKNQVLESDSDISISDDE
jgi:hypothetical protein